MLQLKFWVLLTSTTTNQDVLVNVTIAMSIIYLKGGAINRDVLLFATLRYTNSIDYFEKFDLLLHQDLMYLVTDYQF